MNAYARGFTLCLLIAIIALPFITPAQQVTKGLDIGFPEGGVFSGSNFDNVQLGNGNLHIEIPFLTIPGRGLPVVYKFVYDNRGWTFKTTCDHQGICSDVVQAESGNNMGMPLTSPFDWRETSKTVSMQCVPGINQFAMVNRVLREPDGTKHHFLPDPANPPGTNLCSSWGTADTMYASDGSGWINQANPSAGVMPFIRKDGTSVMPNANYEVVDSNGNQLLFNSTTYTVTDTLGRTNLVSQPYSVSYYDSSGTLITVQVTYTSVSYTTSQCVFSGSDTCTEASGTMTMPYQIILPNNQTYTFTYVQDGYGEPASVTLPDGGQISWTWATDGFNPGGRRVTSRTVTVDGQSSTWTYTYNDLASPFNVVVHDPMGNEVRHTFGTGSDGSPLETEVEYFAGTVTGQLLKTVQTDYSGFGSGTQGALVPIRETTTWSQTNQVTKVETDWDSYSYSCGSINCTFTWKNPLERREFDFGNGSPGALVRRTDYSYLHLANAAYRNVNISDRLTAQTVYDGSGIAQSSTTISYDGNSLTPTSSDPAPNHDYTNFGTTNLLRGNPTQISHWIKSNNTWLNTVNTYDDLGNRLTTTDPGQHTTNFSYDDNWANAACVPSGVNTHGYLTQVTNALGQNSQTSYYPCLGQIASQRNQNDINASRPGTTYDYDLFGRVTQVTTPDGGGITASYNDIAPVSVTSMTRIDSTNSLTTTAIKDGMGRTIQTQLTSNPGCVIKTDTTYDSMGRVSTVSNPYCSTSDPTYGLATTQYDALSRATTIIPPDGSTSANNVTTAYSGSCTTVTDEAGKMRKSCTDALGRLIEVDEPSIIPATPGTGSATVSGSEQSVAGSAATSGTGSVTINGLEKSKNDPTCGIGPSCKIYDFGTVSITVGGHTKTVSYDIGSTGSTIASALANAFNGDASSPVTANASTNIVYLTAKATGSSSNYPLSASYTYDSGDFTSGSFIPSPSGSTLSGGADATSPTYDTGTVWVTVNGFQASVSYGQSSTTTSLASAMVNVFNTSPSSPVSAALSGSQVILTAKLAGSSSNYSLSGGSSTSQPASFTTPSFSISVSGATLTGGSDQGSSFATPSVTLYAYDVLDNLICAVQKGTDTTAFTTCAAAPTTWRPRTFTYNSLSQLLSATNPESGTVSYTYDADGNVITKTAPAPNQTGSTTVTTCFGTWNGASCDGLGYDALHRVTKKTYSNGDPTVTYSYDGTDCLGQQSCSNIGHRTFMIDAAGAEAWSYEAMGRVLADRRTTNSITKDTLYTYNLDGSVATIANPSGRVITYAYNAAARPLSAVDNINSINYATAASYAPQGALASLTLGSSATFGGVNLNQAYNSRLQPTTVQAWSTNGVALDLSYGFNLGVANNGNVASITNNQDNARSQNFTYDVLNRISTAQTASTSGTKCWDEQFGYDPWGNLLTIGRITGYTCSNEETLSVSATTTNQISGYGYDAAGNLTSIPGTGGSSYSYNTEGQLKQAVAGGTTTNYAYDGDGRRMEKLDASNAVTKIYWYGAGSDALAESDGSGTITDEYVFFGGKRIARRKIVSGQPDATSYYFADHLGTARVVTNDSGAILDDSDFYPFGGERPVVSSSGNNYKFTGKERDSESGLDEFGARYYSSALGRFTIPDWAASATAVPYADFGNPQSLNLYGYVLNNPLTNTDLDGHECCDLYQVLNFVGGFLNALGSDNAAGLGRQDQINNATPEGQLGAAVGDTAAGVQGTVEVGIGLVGEGTGILLDGTGGGAPAGLALNAAGVVPLVHGATTYTAATINLAKDGIQTSSGGPKAKDAAGVTSNGQATDKKGNKLGPSGKPQVNETNSNTREAAGNKALNQGRGKTEHRNPKIGKPHFHPTDKKGKKIPRSTHHNFPG